MPVDVSLGYLPTTKAAVKMHALLDLHGFIPSFIHISEGSSTMSACSTCRSPKQVPLTLWTAPTLTSNACTHCTNPESSSSPRAKTNFRLHRLYSDATDRTLGVIADQTVALDDVRTKPHYPDRLRRIRYRDPQSDKTLVFITNRNGLDVLTACGLYQSRWQVALFFK